MFRLSQLLGLLIVLTAICWNIFTGQHHAAVADDHPADRVKRIESLEARVAKLEGTLAGLSRTSLFPTPPFPGEPRYWSKRQFNGGPVYIVPLGDAEAKK